MRVIGLMSGTSYDGIEAAAAELDLSGDTLRMRPLGRLSHPYSDAAAHRRSPRPCRPRPTTTEAICVLDTGIGQAFAEAGVRAVAELCDGTPTWSSRTGRPCTTGSRTGAVRGTLQLGQPAWIAEATGLPVVADLRSRDVAAGGQGAPLVALFDALLLGGLPGVPAALNLGGIANITVVAPDADPLAFDTGPANALLDAAARHFSGGTEEYDRDGARGGRRAGGPGPAAPAARRAVLPAARARRAPARSSSTCPTCSPPSPTRPRRTRRTCWPRSPG